MKKNKRKIEKTFAILLGIILLITVYLNTYLLIKYNVLPLKYLIVYFLIVVLIPILMLFFTIFRRPRLFKRIILYIFEILYIVILFIVFGYLNNTFNFIDNFTNSYDYETKNYYVVVPKDSNYNKIDDLDNKSIGYAKNLDTSIEDALKTLDKKVTLNHKDYEAYSELFTALYANEIDSLLIVDSFYEMLSEEEENPITDNSKILYKFAIKEKVEQIGKEVDVTKDPFIIYISGIGSYGKITDKGLSDVNIVVSVNPKTYEILMVNIPRDYYVPLYGKTGNDKLTHAGLYGVETSLKSIENLLDIEINYYVKVNYNALVGLVDGLDGVEVYSEYDFTSGGKYYHFNKGYNKVNGDHALEFVRTRKAFVGGDRVRGQNQQRMIEAIFKKVSSPAVLLKYDDILKELEGSFSTNLSIESITSIINMQIDKMPNWKINSISLDGSDSYELTFTYPNQELYVMVPKEETVTSAKEALKNMQ